MPYRKVPLVEGNLYHIYTRSIADFAIFNHDKDYQRAMDTMRYYLVEDPPCKFSLKDKLPISEPASVVLDGPASEKVVELIAYCLMPTHLHLILEQLKQNGISEFMNVVLKSYTLYFNTKYNRKGPLWESRFKSILIETQEQFLHLTRYIHLNPATAFLVNDPKEWKFSSYREYLGLLDTDKRTCSFSNYLDMDIAAYEKFVNNRLEYQRELASIKHLISSAE